MCLVVILSMTGSEGDFLLKPEIPACAARVLAQVCFGGRLSAGFLLQLQSVPLSLGFSTIASFLPIALHPFSTIYRMV